MLPWIEATLNEANSAIPLFTTSPTISLFTYDNLLIAADGKLVLSAEFLYYLPPRSQSSWKLDLAAILDHCRHAPQSFSIFGSGTGGRVELRCRVRVEEGAGAGQIWICQVCEELNEGSSTEKCSVCGSKQVGSVQVVAISTNEQKTVDWTCEVCEEANPGTASKCKVCGFSQPRPEPTNTEAFEEFCTVLHFTKGGSAAFYEKFCQVLATPAPVLNAQLPITKAVGIAGLMNDHHVRTQETCAALESAFTDLDSLMRRAGELLKLAGQLAAKSAKSEVDAEGRAALKDLLASIANAGSVADGSSSSSRSSDDFYSKISIKIDRICTALHQKSGSGVLSLADVYLLYCRSGEALIAPADLRRAVEGMRAQWTMKRVNETLCLVQVQAVHLIRQRLESLLAGDRHVFITPLQWSKEAKVSLVMAGEELKMAEGEGWVCKDAKRPGMTSAYYWNIF